MRELRTTEIRRWNGGGVRSIGPRPPPRPPNARVLLGKNAVDREKLSGAYCERARCGRRRDMGVGRGFNGRRGDPMKLSGGMRWADQGLGLGVGNSGPSDLGSRGWGLGGGESIDGMDGMDWSKRPTSSAKSSNEFEMTG